MPLEYKRLIETGFDIIDKSGQRIPFKLNSLQDGYLQTLYNDYPEMQGLRENDLKARQEGFSALIDAIFTVDFMVLPNVGGQIISHKDSETELLMKRVSFYIDSFCEKHGAKRKDLLAVDQVNYLENAVNGSYLFIGTAGAKTLGRGGTLQNIHWSEVGFYPNTEILNAERLVTAAEQQVAMNGGKIFRESTGNMVGDFFYREVERSRLGKSSFKYRFFPWFAHKEYVLAIDSDFTPTEEELSLMGRHNLNLNQIAWYRKKAEEFQTRALFLREYPSDPEEAFLVTGSGYFDPEVLRGYLEGVKEPVKTGYLGMDGGWL